jgi:hypothetical protein
MMLPPFAGRAPLPVVRSPFGGVPGYGSGPTPVAPYAPRFGGANPVPNVPRFGGFNGAGPVPITNAPIRAFDNLKTKARIKKSGLYKLKKGEHVVSAKEMGKLSDLS